MDEHRSWGRQQGLSLPALHSPDVHRCWGCSWDAQAGMGSPCLPTAQGLTGRVLGTSGEVEAAPATTSLVTHCPNLGHPCSF